MRKLEQLNEPPISPVYSQAEPNQPIELGHVAVQFMHKGQSHEDQATVTVGFVPTCELLFVIPAESKSPWYGMEVFHDDQWDGKLTLTGTRVTLAAR